MLILPENEQAYLQRYGRSLQAMTYAYENVSFDKYEVIYNHSKDESSGKAIPEDVRVLFIAGIGDGERVSEITFNECRDIHIIVYEPDPVILLYTCSIKNLSDLILCDRIDIILGTGDIRSDLRTVTGKYVGILQLYHMFAVSMKGYEVLFPDLMSEMIEKIKEIILAYAVDCNTGISIKREVIRNKLYALAMLRYSSLFSSFVKEFPDKNIPIFLIGAGPSLERNVQVLKEAKNHALIIPCTRATQILEKKGVPFDMTVMIDYAEGYDYCACDTERQYRILFHAQSAADIQKAYMGKGIYFGFDQQLFGVSGLRNEISIISTGGSVITCAFTLFLQAGFKNIIFVGEDLAYSEEGKTHSGNYTDSNSDKQYDVEGIDGKTVKTRADWKVFREYIERLIEVYPDVHVIDSSEGGALIRGTEVCTLKEVIDRIKNKNYVDAKKCLEELPKGCEGDHEEVIAIYENIDRKCGDMQLILGDALMLNTMIQQKLAQGIGLDKIQDLIESYDRIYHNILEGEAIDLLVNYCPDAFYNYSDKAQYYLGKDKFYEKLQIENDLFKELRLAGNELRSYVRELKQLF